MLRRFLVLGIESSCDDTSVAIVSSTREILAHFTRSQFEIHEPFKGIVPHLASIQHRKWLPILLQKCFTSSGINPMDLDVIAATRGPGMPPCLSVGFSAGKTLAAVLAKPFIGVHHMEAHALTVRLESEAVEFPYLCLLVSGGHTLLLHVTGVSSYRIIGSTLDDSIGEAFDKVSVMLGFDWLKGEGPAAALEKEALLGNSSRFHFTLPLSKKGIKNNFSFSGLKTRVKNQIESMKELTQSDKQDLACSFQNTAILHVTNRIREALKLEKYAASCIVVAGGVAKNNVLRARVHEISQEFNIPAYFPSPSLCTDNGAMIAWAGVERSKLNLFDDLHSDCLPQWSLEDLFINKDRGDEKSL